MITVPIKGYPNYTISQHGNIKNVARDCFINPTIRDNEYVRVILSRDGVVKTFLLHRLVAQHFIPNPLNLPEVNHKDGDKQNNHVSNLEWCTHSYNIKHFSAQFQREVALSAERYARNYYPHKLSYVDIFEINSLFESGYSLKEISDFFEVSEHLVFAIVNKKDKSLCLDSIL